MRIENLVRITGGVLLNAPSVDSINDILTTSSKVQRENLFIDVNHDESKIAQALENGAYAILTSTIPQIKDEEIAWICVEDINKAIIKIARFYAIQKKFTFITLLTVQYALAKCMQIDKKAKVLSSNPSDALLEILKSKDNETFFVVNSDFITKIDPSITLPKNRVDPDKIFQSGLFYSTFIFRDKYINNLKLSPFFVPFLCALMEYLDELHVEYSVDNFNHFEHFYPQFVNNNLEQKDFGSTDKVLIFETDFELFLKELNFLEERYNHQSLVVFTPQETSFTCKVETIVYKSFCDIQNLKDIDFKYAIIYGRLQDFEESLKMKVTNQMSLF